MLRLCKLLVVPKCMDGNSVACNSGLPLSLGMLLDINAPIDTMTFVFKVTTIYELIYELHACPKYKWIAISIKISIVQIHY